MTVLPANLFIPSFIGFFGTASYILQDCFRILPCLLQGFFRSPSGFLQQFLKPLQGFFSIYRRNPEEMLVQVRRWYGRILKDVWESSEKAPVCGWPVTPAAVWNCSFGDDLPSKTPKSAIILRLRDQNQQDPCKTRYPARGYT
jgi:hypothetical protein